LLRGGLAPLELGPIHQVQDVASYGVNIKGGEVVGKMIHRKVASECPQHLIVPGDGLGAFPRGLIAQLVEANKVI